MPLSGRTVLVMEDNPVLAADLAGLIEDRGARVLGPFRRLSDGMVLLDQQMPDMAILDVELLDGMVLPLADRLTDKGIPFVFYSARYSDGHAAAQKTGAPLLSKSNHSTAAVEMLIEIAERNGVSAK